MSGAAARGRKRAAPGDAADASVALVDAVTALGGGLNGVAIQELPGMGLGLVATRALAAGEWVWRVPAAAFMTSDAALASPVGLELLKHCSVRDTADASESEDGDWRAAWAAREARWAADEAAEAAASGRRRAAGGAAARRRAAHADSGSDEASSGGESASSDGEDATLQPPPPPCVDSRSALYVYLIAARAPGSTLPLPHAAYARCLPASINLPLLWPEADCAQLEGTELARSVALMREHLRREYDTMFPLVSSAAPRLFPRALFTWEAFLWAHAAYASRCFPRSCLPGGGAEGGDEAMEVLGDAEADGVLVPLLDIVNHAPEGADIRWDAPTGTAILKRAVQAGEQVMSCYGAKDTCNMLLHFGFAPWDNSADTLPLRMAATFQDVEGDDALSAAAAVRARGRKQHLFAQLAGGRMALQVALRRGPLPPLLLAAARVCCMSAADAAAAHGDAATVLAGPISAHNERAALSYVQQLLQRRVAALLRGESAEAWAARVAAARAADALQCGRQCAQVAVTPGGAAIACRDAALQLLRAALAAVAAALAAL